MTEKQRGVEAAPSNSEILIEERRRSAEDALWSLPGLSVAAQAFLFSTGLDKDASSAARIVVALIGLVAACGTALVLIHQGLRLMILQRATSALGIAPEQLQDKLPEGMELDARRAWAVRHTPAPTTMWAVTLGVFAIADVFVLVVALAEIAGFGDLLGSG